MATTFNPGDVVQLRSGGPQMTVTGLDDDSRYDCTWFDSKGEQKWGTFKPETLDLHTAARKS